MTTTIPDKLFFKIGEVAEIAGVEQHVLRYWEDEFEPLKPDKNRAGQRLYQKEDVEMVLEIKRLLYEEKYTIAGAKQKLKSRRHKKSPEELEDEQERFSALKNQIRDDLNSVLEILDNKSS